MDKDRPPRDFSDWIGLREVLQVGRARWIGAGVGVLIALILGLALAAAVTLLLRVFDPSSGASGNLGTGALVVAILGAPFVIWNIWIKSRALGFQKEGHITDRINTAVEHLGAEKTVKHRDRDDAGKAVTIEETVPNIEVRIGGLLSLERIAQDSTGYDNGRDHVRVMEILCAYVRENAPARTAKDHPFGEWAPLREGATGEERKAHLAKRKERFGESFENGKVREWARELPPPRADIAQALLIVGRRTAGQRKVEAQHNLGSASETDLVFSQSYPTRPYPSEADLTANVQLEEFKADLKHLLGLFRSYAGYRLDLRDTNLQRANLAKLNFSRALFSGSRMEGAGFHDSTADGAIFRSVRLDGSDIRGSNLIAADFLGARMESADLQLTRMQGVDLQNAHLDGANLLLAEMEFSNLSHANLRAATLLAANLEGATLNGAHLEESDFSVEMDMSTLLEGASLREACVHLVDWARVPISGDQIDSMFGDGGMTLPGGITPRHVDWPAHWPKNGLPKDNSRCEEDYSGPTFDSEYQRWLADPAAYVPPPPPDPAP